MKIDNFALIIGAMKCGTSSLFEYLSQHPEIAACRQKEPHFFCKSENFNRGFDYYQSLWDWNPKLHKIALEASAGYTRMSYRNPFNSAKNIAFTQVQQQVNFKLIYLMRNPIQRIESHYVHDVTKMNVRIDEQVISKVEEKYIEPSMYARQLSEYYQRFSSDNILLLNFDDLKTNPQEVLQKVCNFLEIDSNFQFQQTKVSHNSRDRRRINIPFWHNIRKTALLRSILSGISNQQKSLLMHFFGKQKAIPIEFTSEFQQDVLHKLKPDLNELRDRYKFDFQSWKLNV